MTDDFRSHKLRDDFGGALERARAALMDHESTAELIELYEHGLISSLEIMSFVWESFYSDDAALTRICEQLRKHTDDSIRRIPEYYNKPEFRNHRLI